MESIITKFEREDEVLSIDDIQRIMSHLDRQDEKINIINQSVARILVTVEDVPVIVAKMNAQDTSMQLIKKDQENCQARCAAVQKDKKEKAVSWGSVKTNIIISVIMLIIGAAFATLIAFIS